MRRSRTFVAVVLASVALALTPATSLAASPEQAPARAGGCHRTLAHYPVLVPGNRGPVVRTLQCVLNDAGYGPVVVDGWYGPQTRAAVSRVEAGFEGSAPRPGRVNNGFWVLLFGQQLPVRTLRQGQRGSAVRTLQRALRAAGSELAVNASYGAKTKNAVRGFQRSQGVRANGVVSERTRFFLAMGGVLHQLN